MLELGAAEPLLEIAHGPTNWLRTQAMEMLHLLGIDMRDMDFDSPPAWAAQLFHKQGGSPGGGGTAQPGTKAQQRSSPAKDQNLKDRTPATLVTKLKYHFFSFQLNNYNGFQDEYWPRA
mmetsp:Transcript_54275/g.140146  ORF Transcript_54275/g.140146 Transcript_54275/m.140146 type:complete len:119 (+) Transcript_54275:3-359(+)